MINHRLWPQPSSTAMTVGRMMNMPYCGAVLISRTRKPMRIFGFDAVSRSPALST